MKYLPINNQLFVKNRAKFTAQMKTKSIAVFNSNDLFTTGADSTIPFEQSSDLLYLSGADQEESILLLFPEAIDPNHREILFLTETSKLIEIWYGAKYSKEEAQQVSGIKTIYWLSEFKKTFFDLMTEAERVYFNTNEHYPQSVEIETREDRFIKQCKSDFPAHKWEKSNQILHSIRGVKEPEEIEIMQTACDITNKGFRRVLPFIKPGIMEFEIEAEYMHEFLMNRSKGFAYTPIIGAGYSACVLHYIENNKECKDGDMLLMDVGAEYANYSSDMTRTVPVNGKFTDRQRAVYNAVLRVKNEATNMLTPGALWAEYHKEVGKIMTSELVDLKLLDKADFKMKTQIGQLIKNTLCTELHIIWD